MGISYEKWATCDGCEEQRSYAVEDIHRDVENMDMAPYGFKWVGEHFPGQGVVYKLFCWDCA